MKTIVITGADGSGKTTLCNAIESHLTTQLGLKVSQATIWDIIDHNIFPVRATKQQMGKYLTTLSPMARSLLLFHSLAHSIDIAKKTNPEILLINAFLV
jgi:thymidylate kinase